jgi:creatinine amidohydrolase
MMDENCTTFELAEAAPPLGVIGIGSCEQHSSHLPLETDFFFAAAVSRAVADRLGAMLLNPLPYSTSLEHVGFAGTVTLKPETLKATIWDIAESAGQWGIRHLVLLNAHGGNFVLIPTARQWNMEGRTPRLLLVEFFSGLSGVGDNLHACEVETSLMLYLAPDRVRLDRAVDFVPPWTRADLTHLGMKGCSPRGVWGYPSRAGAEKGRRWFEEAVEYCCRRVRELVEAMP